MATTLNFSLRINTYSVVCVVVNSFLWGLDEKNTYMFINHVHLHKT